MVFFFRGSTSPRFVDPLGFSDSSSGRFREIFGSPAWRGTAQCVNDDILKSHHFLYQRLLYQKRDILAKDLQI